MAGGVTKKGVQPVGFLWNAGVEIFGDMSKGQHGLLYIS